MNRFRVSSLPLEGLKLIERQRLEDYRGFLTRLFCATELVEAGWNTAVAQINHTHTARKGSVRGLHFQTGPSAEKKLVSCLHGKIWDVAVDVRPDSPTFLQWHAEILTANNNRALLIPEGFAHGFQALENEAELIYLHSAPYAPEAESGLNHADPALGIAWPLEIADVSERDKGLPTTDNYFGNAPA